MKCWRSNAKASGGIGEKYFNDVINDIHEIKVVYTWEAFTS